MYFLTRRSKLCFLPFYVILMAFKSLNLNIQSKHTGIQLCMLLTATCKLPPEVVKTTVLQCIICVATNTYTINNHTNYNVSFFLEMIIINYVHSDPLEPDLSVPKHPFSQLKEDQLLISKNGICKL